MTPQLFMRLSRAVDVGAASVEERARITAAAQRARAFEDLPVEVRALVERLERPPV
jgi:hypothetical protein